MRELYESFTDVSRCVAVCAHLEKKSRVKSGHVGTSRVKSGVLISVPPDSTVRFCIGLTVSGVDLRFRQPFWGLRRRRITSIALSWCVVCRELAGLVDSCRVWWAKVGSWREMSGACRVESDGFRIPAFVAERILRLPPLIGGHSGQGSR